MSRGLLCVMDVGNTHTVIGLYRGSDLEHHWRLRTDAERTTDEWGIALRSLGEVAGVDLSVVRSVAIASVVPPAIHGLRRASQRFFQVDPLVVGPGVKTGLVIRYDNPREVGADRVANAVAAFAAMGGPCIVVDFGTATTFDCISENGEYLGGAIAPGIGISLDALVTRAAKLPRVEIARPRSAVGRNTEEAIQSGVLFGYVSLVDGLVDRLAQQMGGDVKVVATGGFAGAIASESRTIQQVSPHLTLEGIRLIWEKNSPA